jgi:gliding motility-associated-like protein
MVAPVKAYGDSLRWYTSATAPAGTGSFTAPVPSVTNPGVTTYYVTQNVMGCESPKVAVKVTVLVLPEFTITAERDWVCQHDSLKLNYNGPLYIDPAYVWTLPVGADFVKGTHFYDKDVEVRFDTVWGRHDVMLEVSNYGGRCSTRDTFSVRVIPAPDAHPYMKTDICLGDTITLALNSHSANSHTYMWTVDGNPMASSSAIRILSSNSNSGGPYVVTWLDSGIHIIHVTGATAEGCLAEPAFDTVKVHTLPDPRYSVTEIPAKFCVEDSVLFKANKVDYAYNYRWEPEHFFSNQNKPEIWGRVQLTPSRITLTVTDPFGCMASYTKTITPDECCTVAMPNAFTPNGDGKNDRYRPIFAGYRRFHVFRITNRWGQTVFESGNSEPSWDGTRNGEPQDMGTYFYYLKYDCGGKVQEAKGDVTLIR